VLQFTWGDQSGEVHSQKMEIPYSRITIRREWGRIGDGLAVLKGFFRIKRLIKKWKIDWLMPRSIFGLLPLMIGVRSFHKPIIYDVDGFLINERIEFGDWDSKSSIVKVLSKFEKKGVFTSDQLLVRTKSAKRELSHRYSLPREKHVFVVSNGRNPLDFQFEGSSRREELGIGKDEKVMIYVGSIGRKYHTRELFDLFLKKQNYFGHLVIVTQEIELSQSILKKESKEPQLGIHIVSAKPEEVPSYIRSADLGMALIQTQPSMKAVVPIKTAEYLLCGIPFAITPEIGDMDFFVKNTSCGYIIKGFTQLEVDRMIQWFDGFTMEPKRLHDLGVEHFGLKITARQYLLALDDLYDRFA
jgi:glycosyltransferase involved in cell wall biosynthesis